jgi:hypothetical protein
MIRNAFFAGSRLKKGENQLILPMRASAEYIVKAINDKEGCNATNSHIWKKNL